jgi:hypothetical protein
MQMTGFRVSKERKKERKEIDDMPRFLCRDSDPFQVRFKKFLLKVIT